MEYWSLKRCNSLAVLAPKKGRASLWPRKNCYFPCDEKSIARFNWNKLVKICLKFNLLKFNLTLDLLKLKRTFLFWIENYQVVKFLGQSEAPHFLVGVALDWYNVPKCSEQKCKHITLIPTSQCITGFCNGRMECKDYIDEDDCGE